MSGRIIGRRRLGRGRARSELDRVPALGHLLRGALETVAAPSNHGWAEPRPPAAPERAAKAAAAGRRPAATSLEQLRVEIANRLRRGDALERVERELIAPSRLSEERQSALWLYGWSLPKLERRRAALAYLEPLAREDRRPPTDGA